MIRKAMLSLMILAWIPMALAAAAADGPVKTYGKGYRFEQDGWIYLHIEGAPHERGMQHGFLIAAEFLRVRVGAEKKLRRRPAGLHSA